MEKVAARLCASCSSFQTSSYYLAGESSEREEREQLLAASALLSSIAFTVLPAATVIPLTPTVAAAVTAIVVERV